jgi:catechol 2,3-dioxygenase-like lactoylglutathione lyase family enzyme
MTLGGISHISLTVTDLDASRVFWVDVMGFVARIEQPALVVLVHPEAAMSLALVSHEGGAADPFDERRVGLDHLALDVDGLETLQEWEATLGAARIERSPITESPFGWHLNVRAPDNIAVELLAMKPEATAMLYG